MKATKRLFTRRSDPAQESGSTLPATPGTLATTSTGLSGRATGSGAPRERRSLGLLESIKAAVKGNAKVSISKGTFLRGLVGSRIDSSYPEDAHPGDIPKRSSNALPRIRVKPVTPYTALSSQDAVHDANAGVRTWTRLDQVVTQTQARIRTGLAAARARPPGPQPRRDVIVIGENHGSTAALAVHTVALAEFSTGPAPTLLLEHSTDSTRNTIEFAGYADTITRAPWKNDPANDAAFARLDADQFSQVAKAHVALAMGGSVIGYDKSHDDAMNLEEREAEMLRSISLALHTRSGPVIISTGDSHLPAIHEALAAHHNVVAIAQTNTDDPMIPIHVLRSSYNLSHPDVMMFQADALLEGAPLDYPNLAQDLNIDLGIPPYLRTRQIASPSGTSRTPIADQYSRDNFNRRGKGAS